MRIALATCLLGAMACGRDQPPVPPPTPEPATAPAETIATGSIKLGVLEVRITEGTSWLETTLDVARCWGLALDNVTLPGVFFSEFLLLD